MAARVDAVEQAGVSVGGAWSGWAGCAEAAHRVAGEGLSARAGGVGGADRVVCGDRAPIPGHAGPGREAE